MVTWKVWLGHMSKWSSKHLVSMWTTRHLVTLAWAPDSAEWATVEPWWVGLCAWGSGSWRTVEWHDRPRLIEGARRPALLSAPRVHLQWRRRPKCTQLPVHSGLGGGPNPTTQVQRGCKLISQTQTGENKQASKQAANKETNKQASKQTNQPNKQRRGLWLSR